MGGMGQNAQSLQFCFLLKNASCIASNSGCKNLLWAGAQAFSSTASRASQRKWSSRRSAWRMCSGSFETTKCMPWCLNFRGKT